jgi:hypothetical protein
MDGTGHWLRLDKVGKTPQRTAANHLTTHRGILPTKKAKFAPEQAMKT